MSNECEECMNARAIEECPECGKELCEYCLEDHECLEDEFWLEDRDNL